MWESFMSEIYIYIKLQVQYMYLCIIVKTILLCEQISNLIKTFKSRVAR